MYSIINSSSLLGVKAVPVCIETDISSGLPSFTMVGGPNNEIRESKDRIWAALKNSGIKFPVAKITVNLSPADLHKEGTSFDLPISIGILVSSEIIPADATKNILFIGELGLDGQIKAVKGVLPIVKEASKSGIKTCIIPSENVLEGSLVPDVNIKGAKTLLQVIEYLAEKNSEKKEIILPSIQTDTSEFFPESYSQEGYDFSEIKGQEAAKRAAVISASGFHSLLMTGPPGTGKSMIAKRIAGILPPLSLDESLEITSIHSIAGKLESGHPLITRRYFQSPHHSITLPALIGGGAVPKPGAISLSHRGVLFLDELPEFDRHTLDSLRQPIEEKIVHINRARYSIDYPSDFLLLCAMNPCPCGYYPDRNKCKCSDSMIQRYLGKISGPILDRIDLCVELHAIEFSEINHSAHLTSEKMREMVIRARDIQTQRYKNTPYRFNSDLQSTDFDKFCPLAKDELDFMKELFEKLQLSVRSYHRILRVSRTIADLDNSEQITKKHLLEATGYRPDMNYWG